MRQLSVSAEIFRAEIFRVRVPARAGSSWARWLRQMTWLAFDPHDSRILCAAISGGYFTRRSEEGIWQF